MSTSIENLTGFKVAQMDVRDLWIRNIHEAFKAVIAHDQEPIGRNIYGLGYGTLDSENRARCRPVRLKPRDMTTGYCRPWRSRAGLVK